MSISPEFLEELRGRVVLSDIIRQHVTLRRQGREWSGLSPFNKEKSPSFTVNDDKQFYHCFSSGKYGDVFTFLMDVKGLSFIEAVELVAQKAGMAVPKPTREAVEKEKKQASLHEVLERACAFFEAELAGPNGATARDYLARRGLTPAVQKRFRLGYAPADRNRIIKALVNAETPVERLIEAGLAKPPENDSKPYGFFKDRVIFPVSDRRGRVVAFGARLLAGEGPKYLNSPDTPVFHKGKLLFNLANAREAANRLQKPLIVVEGYMDVIAMVEAGFETAVAPLGTALTEDQVEECWRACPPHNRLPILCFDGDGAGRRAAFRAVDRILPILRPDHSVQFSWLPQGQDPDSLLRSGPGGPGALLALLEKTEPLVDLVWQVTMEGRDTATPEARAGFKASLDERVNTIKDPVVLGFYRDHLRQKQQDVFGWKKPAWQASNRPASRPASSRDGWSKNRDGFVPALIPPPTLSRPRRGQDARIGLLLGIAIHHPRLVERDAEALAALEISDSGLKRLRDSIIMHLSAHPDLDSAALLCQLNSAGLGFVCESLFSSSLFRASPFARADASADQALAVWRDLMNAFAEDQVRAEFQQARNVTDTISLADEQRLRAFQRHFLDARIDDETADQSVPTGQKDQSA